MKKRLLSVIVALTLCLSLLPTPAWASSFYLSSSGKAAVACRQLTNGRTYVVEDGTLKEAEAGTENSFTCTIGDDAFVLAVNGRVTLPAPWSDYYGVEAYLSNSRSSITITGGELVIPQGGIGLRMPGSYTYPKLVVENASVTVGGETALSFYEIVVKGGASLIAADSSVAGTVTVTGNSTLQAKTMLINNTQTLTVGTGSSVSFVSGNAASKPKKVDLAGALTITDTSADYLTPTTTFLHYGGSLTLGNAPTEVDVLTGAFVPAGTRDRFSAGEYGLDLLGIDKSARFTTLNGGTADWDNDTRTLTLRNAKIDVTKRKGVAYDQSAVILPEGDVTVKLVGTNTLTGRGFGINGGSSSRVTIEGPGELVLDVACYAASGTYAAQGVTAGGDLVVNSGVIRLSTSSITRSAMTCLSAGETLIVNGGSITFNSDATANGCASFSGTAMEINGGIINVKSRLGFSGFGGDVTVTGGSVTMNTMGACLGADRNTKGSIYISGGTLDLTAGSTANALDAGENIAITGGNIKAKSSYPNYGAVSAGGSSYDNQITTLTYSGVTLVTPAGGRVGFDKNYDNNILDSSGAVALEVVFTSNTTATLAVSSDGVGASSGDTYAAGTTVPVSAGTKDGMLFAGWTVSGNGAVEDPDSPDTRVTLRSGTVTLTANWSAEHNVTVTGGGTGASGAGSYRAGDTVSLSAGITAGKVFDGWTTDDPDVTFADAAAADTTFTMPDHDVTVTANWAISTYTVTVVDGGTGVSGGGTYAPGETVTINAGTKSDALFARWITSDAGVYLADAASASTTFVMPDHSVTLTATWDEAYMLTIVHPAVSGARWRQGAAYQPDPARLVRPGDTVTIYAGLREKLNSYGGYTPMDVERWSLSDPDVKLTQVNDYRVSFTMPDHAVTLTVTWFIKSYRVTLVNGGTNAVGDGVYEHGTVVNIDPGTKLHYSFTRWMPDSNIGITSTSAQTSFTMPDKDVTITAYWTENQYGLYAIQDGGSGMWPSSLETHRFSEVVSIKAGAKTGYVFDHWESDNGGTFGDVRAADTTFTNPDANPVKLTAHWITSTEAQKPSLTIYCSQYRSAIMVNGVRCTDQTIVQRIEPGTEVTLVPEYPDTPGFRGWYAGPDAGISFTEEELMRPEITFIMPDHSVRLSVNWWLVHYLSIENVGEGGTESDFFREGTVNISAGRKPGQTFSYWEETYRADSAVTGLSVFGDWRSANTTYAMPNCMATIEAHWSRTANFYTLLVKDGGTGASPSAAYEPGEEVTVSVGRKAGYLFSRWSASGVTLADPTASTVTFTMPEGDVTLTALWEEGGNAVTLVGAGSGASGAGNYGEGDLVTVNAGEKAGHRFAGWQVTSGNVTLSDDAAVTATFTMSDEAVTLTAAWEPLTYTLTVHGLAAGDVTETYAYGATVTVQAGEKDGYTFSRWTAEGVTLANAAASPAVFTMPAGNVTLTALWTMSAGEDNVLTIYLDDFGGDIIIQDDQVRDVAGGMNYPFAGPVVITMRDPAAATANTVTVTSYTERTDFNITLKDVRIAAPSGKAAIHLLNAVDVTLDLEGTNTLAGGGGHAAIELTSTGGSPDTAITIRGDGDAALTAVGGDYGAGIGGAGSMNYGTVRISGGAVTATGGKGAAGVGGGNAYAGSGTGGIGAVEITGGSVTAVGTPDSTLDYTNAGILGASGVGAGYTGGIAPTRIVISGGTVDARAAGAAPAIGAVGSATVAVSGGTVSARSDDGPIDIGVHPEGGGTVLVRLSDNGGTVGAAVVTVTGTDRISNAPAVPVTAGDQHNYYWNGVVFAGTSGQVYRGEYAAGLTLPALTIPAEKTLNIPEGAILCLPEDGLVWTGMPFRGEGWVLLGDDGYFYISGGTLHPCEAQLDHATIYATLHEVFAGTIDEYPLLYGSGHHIKLLSDVRYPEDIVMDFQTTQCSGVELDLNGKTLDMGSHTFLADVAYREVVDHNCFLISDTSQSGTGTVKGNGTGPVVRTQIGLLAISGGSYVNEGSGPALRVEVVRPETKLTGGYFSALETTCTDLDNKPVPALSLVGDGLALWQEELNAWVTPAARKAKLERVTVKDPEGALPALTLEKGEDKVQVAGLDTGISAVCRWYARPYGGTVRSLVSGVTGTELDLTSGALADGSYYISCVAETAAGAVLTEEVLAEAKTPAQDTPAAPNGQPAQSGKTEPAETVAADGSKTTITTDPDGKRTETVTRPDGSKEVNVTDAEGVLMVKFEAPAQVDTTDVKFDDIPDDHWAKDSVERLAGMGLVQGTQPHLFSGMAPMERGMMAALLHRLSGSLDRGENTFVDVQKDSYYAEGVAWAADVGLINGVDGSHYQADRAITRQELAVIMYRYAKLLGAELPTSETAVGFPDQSQVSAWAVEAMEWAVASGLINGMDGLLAPNVPANRAQVVTLLDRFLEKVTG